MSIRIEDRMQRIQEKNAVLTVYLRTQTCVTFPKINFFDTKFETKILKYI